MRKVNSKKQIEYTLFTVFSLLISTLAMGVPVLPDLVHIDNNGVYSESNYDLNQLNYNYTCPPDNPMPPGDTFSLPGSAVTVGNDAPAIGTFTHQANNGSCIILQGKQFGNAHQTKIWGYGQTNSTNGASFELGQLRHQSDSVTGIIDAGSLPYCMYLLWVENADGVSYPVRVNGTDAWWLGPDHSTPGSSISLYGRNLSHDNGTSTSYIYIRPWGADGNTSSTSCTVTAVNPYKVTFTVPAGLTADADYEIWAHNGHGGEYGWSGPLKLHVEASNPYVWNGTTRDITSYGAIANDGLDDTAAIQAAVNAASNGDKIYFPAGTFRISSRIYNFSKQLSFYGAGKNNTTLTTHNSSYSAPSMLDIQYFHSEVRDMKFRYTATSGGVGIILMNGFGQATIPRGAIVKDCIFESSLTTLAFPGIATSFIKDVTITGCTFTSSRTMDIGKCQQVRFSNNTVYGNAQSGLEVSNGICLKTFREVDFSNNTFSSLDRSQEEILVRALAFQNAYGASIHVYVGDNNISGCAPRLSDGNVNAGENIMFEVYGSTFIGSPSTINTTTMVFSGQNWATDQWVMDDLPGWDKQEKSSYVFIQRGPGLGQWRRIIDSDATSITIDRPWEVAPTTESLVSFSTGMARTAVFHNTIDGIGDENSNGTPDYLERNFGLTGIMTFGTCHDFVCTNNTISRVRYGLYTYGRTRYINTEDVQFEGISNALLADNNVDYTKYGIYMCNNAYPDSSGSGDPGLGPSVINNIFRGNDILHSDLPVAVQRFLPFYAWDWLFMVNNVFENNLIRMDNGDIAVNLGFEQGNNIFVNNDIDRYTYSASSTIFQFGNGEYDVHLYNNTYGSNIESIFSGTRPWAIDICFEDSGKSDGDSYSSSPNLGWNGGSTTATTYGSGQILYEQGNGGTGDLGVQLVDTNQPGGVSAAGAKLEAQFPAITGDFTFMLSFRLDGDQVVYDRIVDTFGNTSIMVISAPRTVRFTSGSRYIDYTCGDGQWVHMAVTYDHMASATAGRSVLRFYVNGQKVTAPIENIAYDATFSALTAVFGSQPAGTRPMNGAIDDIMLFDRVLTPLEIEEEYNASLDIR